MCGGPDALRRGWWVTRETLRPKGHPGLYLRSPGGESSAWPRGEGFPPEPKSPSSGSTSSSKIVSRGVALGFTATAGCFLGFLELENHRRTRGWDLSREPCWPGAPWSDAHRRGAGWRLCQEGPCQEHDDERVRRCCGNGTALCPGNSRCGDARRDQVGVWTVQPLQTTPSPGGRAGRVTGQRTRPLCGAPSLGTPWGQAQSHCTDAPTWG